MSASPLRWLWPPRLTDYELNQRAKLLHVMLMAGFAGALLIGLYNYSHGWLAEAVSLFSFSAILLLGLYLNHSARSRLAGSILCVSMLAAIHANQFYGLSLYDEGVLGYPILMLCAAFLFGKRGLVLSTLASIASLSLLYWLHVSGFSDSPYDFGFNRVIIMSALFVLLAAVGWVVRETWETHLSSVRQSYELTLQGWARALEYRDGETAGHTRRVSELCINLARKLGCNEDEINQIRRGAYLHDIGKMALPDSILFKPGPLSEEEIRTMRQHPDLAISMVGDIPYLQSALAIPAAHHENWDGSGYPRGLKEEQIPLAARIFTVVDHWDALNADRPYRKAWPREDVIAHLRENAGRIYDPQIVDAFLKIVK